MDTLPTEVLETITTGAIREATAAKERAERIMAETSLDLTRLHAEANAIEHRRALALDSGVPLPDHVLDREDQVFMEFNMAQAKYSLAMQDLESINTAINERVKFMQRFGPVEMTIPHSQVTTDDDHPGEIDYFDTNDVFENHDDHNFPHGLEYARHRTTFRRSHHPIWLQNLHAGRLPHRYDYFNRTNLDGTGPTHPADVRNINPRLGIYLQDTPNDWEHIPPEEVREGITDDARAVQIFRLNNPNWIQRNIYYRN